MPLNDRIAANASITATGLVQAMEDAGTVDLRGDKVVPVIAQLLGPATGNANADLGLRILTDWNAAGAHRRDLDGDGVYEHAAAVALMDRWWTPLTDTVFATLGARRATRFRSSVTTRRVPWARRSSRAGTESCTRTCAARSRARPLRPSRASTVGTECLRPAGPRCGTASRRPCRV